MLVATLTLDGRDFYLPPDADLEALKARITEIARAGGGFVDLPHRPGHTTSVFVGAATRIRIDTFDSDDTGDDASANPTTLSSFDLEWDFEFSN